MANRQDFEDIVLPHVDALYRAAMALCRNSTEADDLVQTTFMKALERFETFQEGTNCKAWLLRILRNTWIDSLRHKKTVGPVVPIEEDWLAAPSQENETVWTDARDIIENFSDEQIIKALKELPDQQRFTLFLFDVEGLSSEEVAAITGVETGTVRSRASRARGILKAKLFEHAKDLGLAGSGR